MLSLSVPSSWFSWCCNMSHSGSLHLQSGRLFPWLSHNSSFKFQFRKSISWRPFLTMLLHISISVPILRSLFFPFHTSSILAFITLNNFYLLFMYPVYCQCSQLGCEHHRDGELCHLVHEWISAVVSSTVFGTQICSWNRCRPEIEQLAAVHCSLQVKTKCDWEKIRNGLNAYEH